MKDDSNSALSNDHSSSGDKISAGQVERAQIEQLNYQIIRRLAALIEHPDTPDLFKNHPVVRGFIS